MESSILDFLLRAKTSTYAAHAAETSSSRPNSHDLRYAEGDLLYIDTYLGGVSFAGEEAVWKDGVPVWTMNYCGRVIGQGFDGDFLKNALMLVPRERPFRGPEEYNEGAMQYQNHSEGTIDWYQGYEEISLGGTRIYECFYHGGNID